MLTTATAPNSGSVRSVVLTFWPVLVCVALMLPRLASPQFGLLDDGRTLATAEQITRGVVDLSWDQQAGRFRPAYWLLAAGIYRLAGPEPFWFFFANLVIFAVAVGLLIGLVRLEGGSRLQSWTAGFLFALSGPAIESFYTLSKGETPQILWLLTALVVLGKLAQSRGRWTRIGAVVIGSLILLLAHSTKETSLVMLPISAGWWLVEVVRGRRARDRGRQKRRTTFLLANIIAAGAFLLIRSAFLSGAAGGETYTFRYLLEARGLVSATVRWAGWLLRDFPYLVPLGILVALGLALRRRLASSVLLIDGLIWVAGWTVVFLPWPWTDEYYLLPCAVGCAWLAAAAIDMAVTEWQAPPSGLRWLARACLLLGALGLVITLPNDLASARIQLAVDQENARLINSLADGLPMGSRLVVNLQEPREYFEQLGVYLHQVRGRPDVELVAFDPTTWGATRASAQSAIVVSPEVSGVPYFTVRIGVDETDARDWGASLQNVLPPEAVVIYQSSKQVRWLNVNLPSVLCEIVRVSVYCREPRPVLEQGEFVYGWREFEIRPGGTSSP